MSRRLVVISGGLSQPSSTRLLADRIAGAVSREVTARGEGLDVEVVELRPLARDIADHLVTGMPSARLRDALAAVSGAAAVVAVTPVFTASYSGLFKSFVDLLDPGALTGTPVLIAATAGTARHSLVLDYAMRPLFSYLRAQVVPTGVFAATEDFGGDGAGRDGVEGLDRRIARAAAELGERLVATGGAVAGFTAPAVDEVGRIDELDDAAITPFAKLLRGES
ncbi:FMN reductase [Ornithinicoccus hortensis]|uniref:FMN reductase n=1 Tax=Ornithinicoccus hortensis TaxID=82346 RepID=A0A542YS61_9MICO|nr:FMN reductase [Ornithinicoccus hortensis]TQL50907.1 FMN reductase [Ornithinicoccus hortensis]